MRHLSLSAEDQGKGKPEEKKENSPRLFSFEGYFPPPGGQLLDYIDWRFFINFGGVYPRKFNNSLEIVKTGLNQLTFTPNFSGFWTIPWPSKKASIHLVSN